MTKISQIKYPTYNARREIWISAIIVAVLVYLFLAVFQPFGTYNFTHTSKYLLLGPYSLIAFTTFFTGDFLISKYFRRWTWKNEISKNLLLLLVCSILNYGYSTYFVNDADFNFRALFYMMVFTYTLGAPICSVYILGRYGFLKSTIGKNEISDTGFETEAKTENTLCIIPDVGKKISISISDFLFAQSEGNYSNIFYLKEDTVRKQLLRISFKKLEEQVCNDEIIRCHRSYIFNIQKVIEKKGNAQGYKISLRHVQEKISVSRKYIEKISGISV